ncbi:MAG: TonB-dependent receptor, partial [Caulobacteraceae bacterium]
SVAAVIVVAQKRPENIQNVPISMEVVTGEKLEELGIHRFEDLAYYVPNFSVNPTPGTNQIYIRGIGSGAQNFAFDQAVSIYDDGVYGGRGRQFMAPFFDIDHVEVLRGPQGALLGKNTAAGAVIITSAQPTSTFQAGAQVTTLFERPGIEAEGYVSGPITDTLSGRLAGKIIAEDGWVKNRFDGVQEPRDEDKLIRGILRYAPTPNFNISAKAEYSDFKVKGTPRISIFPGSNDFQNAETAQGSFDGDTEGFDRTTSWDGVITANLLLGGYTLTSITAYSAYDNKLHGLAGVDLTEGFTAHSTEKFHQTSQEVRLVSPTNGFYDFIVGGYVDASRLASNYEAIYDLFGDLSDSNQGYVQTESSWSVFGQGGVNLGRMLRLQGSLRYTHEAKSAQYILTQLSGDTLFFGPPTAIAASDSEHDLDPSVTLQFRPISNVMLYVTYGHGSKAGGFDANSGNETPATFAFEGETSKNYEGGIKSSFFDGRLVLDLTVFDTDFSHLQVSNYTPGIGLTVTNAGAATSRGAEFVGAWTPVRNLRLNASVAYLDAKYDDFPGGPCIFPNLACDLATNNDAGTVLPFASKWSGNVGADYTWDLPDDLKLTGSLLAIFRSSYFTESSLDPASQQPAYAKLDARLELAGPNGHWSVALIGRNLTNEHTWSFSYFWPFDAPTPAHREKYLQETRVVGIEARVKF